MRVFSRIQNGRTATYQPPHATLQITSSSMLVFPSLRFRNMLQLLQVGAATCRLLVRDQVVQRDEVNRNTEEGASNPTLPRGRKLDTGDLRENVYPNWRYADLISQLGSCECIWSDLVGFKRSAEFFKGLEQSQRILR